MADRLSHVDEQGGLRMVDVGDKEATQRRAVFATTVELSPSTFALLQEKALPKGDVLTTAKIAGIQAAKKTSELIPLCHPLALSHIQIDFELDSQQSRIHIRAEARTKAETGVEMEALVAAQTAAMTIYDMCKAVQRDIRISECYLMHKSGGRSQEYNAGQ
ncbi:MAG: cyclic pyranopterin monophosphate synthase MoaC [Desulfohalobiaceae bacterium]